MGRGEGTPGAGQPSCLQPWEQEVAGQVGSRGLPCQGPVPSVLGAGRGPPKRRQHSRLILFLLDPGSFLPVPSGSPAGMVTLP